MRFSEFGFLTEAPIRLSNNPTDPAEAQLQAAIQAQQARQAKAQQAATPQPQATAPAPAAPQQQPSLLNKVGTAIKGAGQAISRYSPVTGRADEIFLNKFNQKLKMAKLSAPPGQFDYQGFAAEYLSRNRWNPGTQKLQLDSAIQRRSDLALSQAMLKIGKANTIAPPQLQAPNILGTPTRY